MAGTLWQGRFAGTMSDAMRALDVSLGVDLRLLPYDLRVNRVWAGELARLGVINGAELTAIEQALDTITAEAGTYSTTLPDEDVHSLVERRVTELAGPAGAKLHTGRSRNDQVITDLRLSLKDAGAAVRAEIRAVIEAAIAQAEQHRDTLLPGYTHLQQAQPIRLAHYLLSLAMALRDDDARLQDALGRMDSCPLGSGAIAGSAFPVDRARVATALGFARETPNSIAATSHRDECLEMASACAICMTHLSRYAEDGIIWSTQEFGFVTFDDRVTTGSSMMPQKKNPDACELVRGKTARVLGQLQTLFALMKGLPLAYARDLQEDKPALFDLLDQTLLCLRVFAEVWRTATFHAGRMRARIDAGLYATDVADYLVQRGLPFRQAHEVVGRMVREAQAAGRAIAALSLEELRTYSDRFAADVASCFDPAACVERRSLVGGTGADSVSQQLTELRAWLDG